MRDGFMSINGNSGPKMNYEPNSHEKDGPFEDKSKETKAFPV